MAFADELLAAASARPVDENPFVRRVCDGTATREELRSFAVHLAASAESFVRSLHAILAICDEASVRQSLIANVLEEEGAVSFAIGDGATFDPERRHATLARRFARAAGATDAELNAFKVGPPRWFVQALNDREWLGPFAYIAVGTESNAPPTYRLLIPALAKHYGFSDHELQFFSEHVTADDRHAMDGALLIASIASTDALRAKALDGARRGGRGWWQILRKHVGA
ncbi:MAG TPA: iron-containing redox enzyme family protein [Thermoanaerobaculia bacterium]|nr:iron-containing redox enzyme family protein [Thermoanaerobaculia bacterium]